MLSRVADAMFWMSRYVERAACVARLLDVATQLDLELHGVVDGSQDTHWRAVLDIMHEPHPGGDGAALSGSVSAALTFDLATHASIMTCVNRARNNARSIRGSISSDMWRELNKVYWQLTDAEFRGRTQDAPYELYQMIQTASQAFQGVCDATLIHDEGWRFIQLGMCLERADKTLRTVDVRQRQLRSLGDLAEPSLQNLHWASVLKSCQAFQAYQQLYISRVEPDRVLDFLLFNCDFPHSVRFCLQTAAGHLSAIGGREADRSGGPAERVLGRAICELEYADPAEVLHDRLSGFIETIRQRCAQAVLAVREQYSLV